MIAARAALILFVCAAIHAPGMAHAEPSLNQLVNAKSDELSNLRRRVGLDPGNADLRFQLAKELARRKQYVESIWNFRQLIAGQPDDADYHLGLGQALLWNDKPQDALGPLRAAIKLAPGYEDAQRALGQALVAAGRLPEARQHWTQAAKRFPKAKWPGEMLAEVRPQGIVASAPTSTPKPPDGVATSMAKPPVAPTVSISNTVTGPAEVAVAAAPAPVPALPPDTTNRLVADASALFPSRTRIEAGMARERLSNGSSDWTEEFVALTHDTVGRVQSASVKLSHTERFGLKDTTATFAAGSRLSRSVVGTVELGISSTHRVLAKRSMQGGLSMALEQGFGIAAALRQIDYNTTRLRAVDLTVERYIGDYRVAYSIHPSRSNTAGNALGHRLQLGHFYGEDNQMQVLLAGGSEVDRPEVGIINQSQVRAIALFGRHWLTPYWAIGFAASHTRQEQTRRNGLTISLIGRL